MPVSDAMGTVGRERVAVPVFPESVRSGLSITQLHREEGSPGDKSFDTEPYHQENSHWRCPDRYQNCVRSFAKGAES